MSLTNAANLTGRAETRVGALVWIDVERMGKAGSIWWSLVDLLERRGEETSNEGVMQRQAPPSLRHSGTVSQVQPIGMTLQDSSSAGDKVEDPVEI